MRGWDGRIALVDGMEGWMENCRGEERERKEEFGALGVRGVFAARVEAEDRYGIRICCGFPSHPERKSNS